MSESAFGGSESYGYLQSLKVHSGSVRALCTTPAGQLISGSIDKSIKFFAINEEGRYVFDKEILLHDSFVYSLACGHDSFFSSSKDKKILRIDFEGNPIGIFEGH